MSLSLRNRLLVAALTLVVLGLLAADVATYRALSSFLYDRIDAQLVAASDSVEEAIFDQSGSLARVTLTQLAAVAPGVYVQVRDGADRTVATVDGRGRNDTRAVPRVPSRLQPIAASIDGEAMVASWPSAGSGQPGYRVRLTPFRGGGLMLVALPLDDIDATQRRLLAIEVVVTIAVVAGMAGLGTWLVRVGLRPLDDIEATAAAITAGDLTQRVADTDPGTEVGRLGQGLNAMLDTLDTALAERRASEDAARSSEQRMRRFVGDASHELRTPVAAVRAYAELYRRGADQRPEDLGRLLSRIETEAERMGLLVEDLLLLTRLDEKRPLEEEPVDLGALAAEAIEAARAVDPERDWELAVHGSVEVRGDRVRLRQVVDNLLANVRAHTPDGVGAAVWVGTDSGRAQLTVTDRGPGFGPGDPNRLLERFARADESRSRDSGGAGLGLSIVDAIVTAHGGTVTAANGSNGGAVVRVSLPLLG